MKRSKWIRVCLCALAMLALLCAPALAKTVSPNADFYYLDNANVLSEALEGEIFFANKLLYDACGAQIVVVTVDTTGREAIDDYTYELGNSWKIGDASKQNGFVLLLAIDDQDYYALPGPGLDSRFSAGTIKDYYDRYLEADFAAGNYEAGVKKFFEATFSRIADIYNADVTIEDAIAAYDAYVAENSAQTGFGGYNGTRRSEAQGSGYRDNEDTGLGFGFLLVLVLIIVLIVAMSKGRRARRRMGVMPPPPPPPVIGGVGYAPTRRVVHRAPSVYVRPHSTSGWSSGSSRSSFGSSSSHSSFGSSSSRSSFGSGHSSGFGGARSGGGSFRGGGAGRGR